MIERDSDRGAERDAGRDRQDTPEPEPIAPAPADRSPSATGVIAGDEDEVKPADC